MRGNSPRCQDLLCQHTENAHDGELATGDYWSGRACGRCPCTKFRDVTPRHQQLQLEFAKMTSRGETFIDWLSVPDPTAERKPSRGIETVGYL